MKRLHLYVSGVVQGVGFRWYTEKIALSCGLTGWVKNLSDGRVEIVAEGEEKNLYDFLDKLKNGYLGKNISEIKKYEEDYKGEFRDFSIRF